MPEIIKTERFVATGELVVGSDRGLFTTSPLGSCVAIIAYDKNTKIGGIAHVMLPGKSLKASKEDENKYAENAIPNLINQLILRGVSKNNIEICLVGGANVLRKENDSIAKNVVSCVVNILKEMQLTVKKSSLGGYNRRSASLNLYSGVVNYSVGDNAKKKLWSFSSTT